MRALREHPVTMLDAQYLKTRGIYFKELPKRTVDAQEDTKSKFFNPFDLVYPKIQLFPQKAIYF